MADNESCTCKVPDMSSIDGMVFCIGCSGRISLSGLNTQSQHVLSEISSTTTASHFVHKRLLQPTHFRLIRVLPGRDQVPIVCEILRFNIDDHPPYEAISYTWGNTSATEQIYTQTGPLDVTVNCKAALTDLRRENSDRLLWIDAVCINQADILEKNHQVPLMSKIYSEAECVLIHLGQDRTPQLRGFFQSLRHGMPANGDQGFATGFLSRPWFSRVWVLQEAAVAKKSLVVVGLESLDWKFLTPGRLHALGHQTTNNEGKIPPILVQTDSKPLKDLISLINAARGCSSTDPRDKIYALLGLLENPEDLPIVPDYNLPVEDLFSNVTAQVIETYNHLDILADARTQFQQEPLVETTGSTQKLFRKHTTNFIDCVMNFDHSAHPDDLRVLFEEPLDRSRRLMDYIAMPDYESTTSEFQWAIELHKPWQGMKRLVEQVSKSQGVEDQETVAMKQKDGSCSITSGGLEAPPKVKALYDALGVSTLLESSVIFPNGLLFALSRALNIYSGSVYQHLLDEFVAGASQLPISDRKLVRDVLYMYLLISSMEEAPGTFHRLAEGITSKEIGNGDSLDRREVVPSIPSWVLDFSESRQISSLAYWRPRQGGNPQSSIASIRASQSHETQIRRVGYLLEVNILRLESIKVLGIWTKPCGPVFISGTYFERSLTQPRVSFRLLENFDKMGYGRSFEDIQTFSRGRDMRLTKRSLAICPPAARDLDIVCILDGASVPFVLRTLSEDTSKFLLVGECYLHGCKGPTFANNYLELMGQYRQFFDAETADDLPWETVYLV